MASFIFFRSSSDDWCNVTLFPFRSFSSFFQRGERKCVAKDFCSPSISICVRLERCSVVHHKQTCHIFRVVDFGLVGSRFWISTAISDLIVFAEDSSVDTIHITEKAFGIPITSKPINVPYFVERPTRKWSFETCFFPTCRQLWPFLHSLLSLQLRKKKFSSLRSRL